MSAYLFHCRRTEGICRPTWVGDSCTTYTWHEVAGGYFALTGKDHSSWRDWVRLHRVCCYSLAGLMQDELQPTSCT